jgi:hypothetical protein
MSGPINCAVVNFVSTIWSSIADLRRIAEAKAGLVGHFLPSLKKFHKSCPIPLDEEKQLSVYKMVTGAN